MYWTTLLFCKSCTNVKMDHEDIFLRYVHYWLDNKINHLCLLAFICKLIWYQIIIEIVTNFPDFIYTAIYLLQNDSKEK